MNSSDTNNTEHTSNAGHTSNAELTSNASKKRTRSAWEPTETSYVLNSYNLFKDEIGRGKRFNTQKVLWEAVALEMADALGSNKTGYQVGQHFQNINRRNTSNEKSVNIQQKGVVSSPVIGSVINVEEASIISSPVISLIEPQERNDSQSVQPNVEEICDNILSANEEPLIITVPIPLPGGSKSHNKSSADKSVNKLSQNSPQANIPFSTQLNFGFQGLNSLFGSNNFPRLGVTSRASNVGVATVYGLPSNRVMPLNSTDALRTLPSTNTASDRLGSVSASTASVSAPMQLATSSNMPIISNNTRSATSASTSDSVCWTVDETKCLLEEYYCYMDEVGPLKLFRTKKALWDTLARKLNVIFDTVKTGEDLEKRLKVLIEKKKEAVNNNRVSGRTRMVIEYEEELSKISALDDSIEPEVLRGVKSVKYKKSTNDKPETGDAGKQTKKPRWDKPNKKRILDSLSDTMMAIEQRRADREIAKEERRAEKHAQMMEVLRTLKKD